ncbi:MAG: copper chaperone PCu(A)C [Nannocystaceae bacterium]
MRTSKVVWTAAALGLVGLGAVASFAGMGDSPARNVDVAASGANVHASGGSASEGIAPRGQAAGGPGADPHPGGRKKSRGSRWGADYFPNVALVTHEGNTVRFFDDLIKDKVVVINFIYTSCPDSCPLETARMSQLEKILGDRVGQDVFMYSITIDPENDTPEVLKAYSQRYDAGPGWLFLTGDEDDIVNLRKKLGLYIEEIQNDTSNNHNLSLIIGNQATGQWMKRSPFENPHILATHVGSWLHNWKLPSKSRRDYGNAPKLRSISDGERLFRTRCAACHTIGGTVVGGAVATDATGMGPDLLGVTEKRDPKWLARWLAEPDKMLAERDPTAMELYARYNKVAMPNMRLGKRDVADVMKFMRTESQRLTNVSKPVGSARSKAGELPGPALSRVTARFGSLAAKGAWVREAHPDAAVNAGYLTLLNSGREDVVLIGASSPSFDQIEFHETFVANGRMSMRALDNLRVPAGGELRLERGGKHLMLQRPRERLLKGAAMGLTFEFESGRRWTLSLPVVSSDADFVATANP